ncbi:MAG TPA: HAMP domain-containing sensor histidine kinase [Acidimicrobiales bacterium]|nr:HAMP domain-containing sensor histidine kinase [Acidimicrobiales bacterium]
MRRRLTVAMTLMVAVSLVLAGVVTLLLTVRDTREQTRQELVVQARGLARGVRTESETAAGRAAPGVRLRQLLAVLKAPLRLNGETVLVVTPAGAFVDPSAPRRAPVLPSGLRAGQLQPTALLAGRTVTGSEGALVWAAVPFVAPVRYTEPGAGTVSGDSTEVVVLTRSPPTGLASAGPWFLVVAAAIIALALLVANRLGHRIVRPLDAARAVTERIAGGDLDARVPDPPGTDPELAALSQSVNTMAASLARARGLERQFLLSVSHDLRTPLTSIRGFAEAIADGAAEDTQRAAGVIAAESRRLERLVGDLLDLAKLDARRFSLDGRPVNLGEVVGDTAEGFRPAADHFRLQLAVDVGPPDGRPDAIADPDRLAQVVANLVENAIKFARTEVRVGTAWAQREPVLWVDDDGPGLSAGEGAAVFERLYTAGRRADRPEGSGLGLAIVAELVTAMGGSVRAESPLTAAGGTRMVVTLKPAGGVR